MILERIEAKQFKDFVQQIDDIEFFAGDTIVIPFQFIDYDNDVITINKGNRTYVKWSLCPYGHYQNPLVELKSDPSSPTAGDILVDDATNTAYVRLDSSITNKLIYGKYVQQIALYYDFGDGQPLKEFRRAQGFVIFKLKIDDM